MGGQACVFYGAAEFSRDIDCALRCNEENLARLRTALKELDARVIAVPPFEVSFLLRGFAVRFRCNHPDCAGLRLDLMAKMRGVDDFPALWERRTTIELTDGETCDLMSISDLVKAKKTQRDKDWPMITRLVAEHYFEFRHEPTPERLEFWLLEARTPIILQQVATAYPDTQQKVLPQRPLLALCNDLIALETALRDEEWREREDDRLYWTPLKGELEELRRAHRSS
jgi:hypothetical protein